MHTARTSWQKAACSPSTLSLLFKTPLPHCPIRLEPKARDRPSWVTTTEWCLPPEAACTGTVLADSARCAKHVPEHQSLTLYTLGRQRPHIRHRKSTLWALKVMAEPTSHNVHVLQFLHDGWDIPVQLVSMAQLPLLQHSGRTHDQMLGACFRPAQGYSTGAAPCAAHQQHPCA